MFLFCSIYLNCELDTFCYAFCVKSVFFFLPYLYKNILLHCDGKFLNQRVEIRIIKRMNYFNYQLVFKGCSHSSTTMIFYILLNFMSLYVFNRILNAVSQQKKPAVFGQDVCNTSWYKCTHTYIRIFSLKFMMILVMRVSYVSKDDIK